MKRKIMRLAILVLTTAVLFSGSLPAVAADSWDMGKPQLWKDEKDQNAWTKLGRGAGNVLFGWCEIFRQPALMSKDHDPTTAFLGGAPKGLLFAAGRMVVGAYEVVTFPIPAPEGYEPIIVPETAIYEA